MSDLRDQATDPHQYDAENMDWLAEGDGHAPSRLFIREYIDPLFDQYQPESVLDIGCGTAWLSEVLTEKGVRRYVGMDPCHKSIAFAKQHYPNAEVHRTRFEDFRTKEQFDMAVCILSSEHLNNLAVAFRKWHSVLKAGGTLLIVAGDFDATLRPRFDYKLVIEQDVEDEAVVKIIRPSEPVSTTDIVRTPERFRRAAKAAGFTPLQQTPMIATETYIANRPKYEFYRDNPCFQLFLFAV